MVFRVCTVTMFIISDMQKIVSCKIFKYVYKLLADNIIYIYQLFFILLLIFDRTLMPWDKMAAVIIAESLTTLLQPEQITKFVWS
jgi:hypothetical protein